MFNVYYEKIIIFLFILTGDLSDGRLDRHITLIFKVYLIPIKLNFKFRDLLINLKIE